MEDTTGTAGRPSDRTPLGTAARAASGARRVIRRSPSADRVYRVGVGAVGGSTVALGVVLMPLPGPGSLVVLGGLGILATEFEGARKASRRANDSARRAYRAAMDRRERARSERSAQPSP